MMSPIPVPPATWTYQGEGDYLTLTEPPILEPPQPLRIPYECILECVGPVVRDAAIRCWLSNKTAVPFAVCLIAALGTNAMPIYLCVSQCASS